MSLTLRDLPLPVKVVVSVFLMAVGLGYTSAIVQLHMQDSKSGKPMPTVEDVVRKYTGKKKADPNDPELKPISRLEALVTCPANAISGNSMSGAFTTDDRAKGALKYANAIKGKSPEQVVEINAQRVGEQIAVALWVNAPEEPRRAAYAADKFVPPAGKLPKTITAAFLDGDGIKIKSIVDNRCVTCHSKGGDKEDVPLDTYDGLAKFMGVEAVAAGGDWVKVEEPVSLTKLTQSTHAHLLSFAMLFSLTGLVFALSSYPVWARCVLGPWVVLAVFADVSLWWLARLSDEWGPYFAMGIIGTGGLAGLGLAGQITLGLFNMYGRTGKAVLVMLMLFGGGIAALVIVNKVVPGLKDREKQNQPPKPQPEPPAKGDEPGKKEEDKSKPNGVSVKDIAEALRSLDEGDAARQQAGRVMLDKGVGEARRREIEQLLKDARSDNQQTRDAARRKFDDVKKALGVAVADPPKAEASALEKLLAFPVAGPDGRALAMEETPFTGGDDGNMARAFFDKEKVFRNKLNDPAVTPEEKVKLNAERDGERLALIAWIRSADAARKTAYDADAFARPSDLSNKPISAEYVKDGKVSIKTLIADRCLRCHGEGGKQYEEYPLDTYDALRKYLNPPPAAPPAGK
jgi:hypothetical protein